MNYYTLNAGFTAKLTTLESDVETLTTSVGTLENDVEALSTAVDALTDAMAMPVATDTAITSTTLTVSGGATPSLTVTDIDTENATMIAIQVANSGASTSTTVNAYGQIGSLGYTTVGEFTAMTLNATTARNDIIIIQGTPVIPYDTLKVVIANADAANEATVVGAVRVFKKA